MPVSGSLNGAVSMTQAGWEQGPSALTQDLCLPASLLPQGRF